MLSRRLASMNHYPAIDVLQSVSRVMTDVVPEAHRLLARRAVEILATYREAEDLVNIGAYVKGSNPRIDHALSMIDPLNTYLKQEMDGKSPYEESVQRLMNLMDKEAG